MSAFMAGISIRVTNHAIDRWRERIDPAPIGKLELNQLARKVEEPDRELTQLLALGDSTVIGLRDGDPPLYGVLKERDAVMVFQPCDGDSSVILVTCLRKSTVQKRGRRKGRKRAW